MTLYVGIFKDIYYHYQGLYFAQHDVWTGARNGVVRLFDLRTGQDQNVLSDRSKHASVAHLRRIREYQLLVATTDNSVSSCIISERGHRYSKLLKKVSTAQYFRHSHGSTLQPQLRGCSTDPVIQGTCEWFFSPGNIFLCRLLSNTHWRTGLDVSRGSRWIPWKNSFLRRVTTI